MKKMPLSPDINNTSKMYWDLILESHGFSMNKGLMLSKEKHIGTSKNLVDLEQENAQGGRVRPSGYGPERDY